MPTITLEHYGVRASGRNVTEAKRAAGEEIKRRLGGDYAPALLSFGGQSVLIWREPGFGWGYKVLEAGETSIRIWRGCGMGDGGSREDAMNEAARHLCTLCPWQMAREAVEYAREIAGNMVATWVREMHDWYALMDHATSCGLSDERARLVLGGLG